MSTIVGVPILKDARRFHFEKGRRWSVFEHAILEALTRQNYTIEQLRADTNLPRRVVVEILIRLMRSGWVEVRNRQSYIEFQATPIGAVTATLLELPPVTEPSKRFIGFAIELLYGNIFYSRDLTIVKESDWERATIGRPAVQIAPPQSERYTALNVRRLSEVLLDDDEELIRVDLNEWKPAKRVALVTVVGDKIEGFGQDIPAELTTAILEAASRTISSARRSQSAFVSPSACVYKASEYQERAIQFRPDDIVLSGPEHLSAVKEAGRIARHRIVLHSTFVDYQRSIAVLEALRPSINRNVHIDLLWGQSFEREGLNTTREAATKLREHVAKSGFADRVNVHVTSSRSHSKILFHDRGTPDEYVAIVGSCNWLSTSYDSVEASLRLRSNSILSDVCFELAELAKPQDGQITDFSAEFVRLGRSLQRYVSGATNATAKLILGHEHGQYVRQARDQANKRILMLSHRLGVAAKPNLIPLSVAARENQNLAPEVYFGRFNDDVDVRTANENVFEYRDAGVMIRAIQKPRVHAKVLSWDDEHLLVTSNNWLSADTSSSTPHRELGVLVSGASAARHFREKFLALIEYGQR